MWPFNKEDKMLDVSQEMETKQEIWTPVLGYEKYYVQNSEGKIKSLGKEFDLHIENGISEEKAAYYTMCFLKGYFGKDSKQANNINKVIEVMDKKWNITKTPKTQFNNLDELGLYLLAKSSIEITAHLLSDKHSEWKSGFLDKEDIIKIEQQTNKKVQCSTESGEYFYKLE